MGLLSSFAPEINTNLILFLFILFLRELQLDFLAQFWWQKQVVGQARQVGFSRGNINYYRYHHHLCPSQIPVGVPVLAYLFIIYCIKDEIW